MLGLHFEEIHMSLRSYKTIHRSICTSNLEQCWLQVDPAGKRTRHLSGLASTPSQAIWRTPGVAQVLWYVKISWGACKDIGSDATGLPRSPTMSLNQNSPLFWCHQGSDIFVEHCSTLPSESPTSRTAREPRGWLVSIVEAEFRVTLTN